MYTNDLESDFIEECIHFQRHCMAGIENPSEKSLQGISEFSRFHSIEDIYPHLDISLRISLCVCAYLPWIVSRNVVSLPKKS